jgi:hypothetical protein
MLFMTHISESQYLKCIVLYLLMFRTDNTWHSVFTNGIFIFLLNLVSLTM